MSDEQGEALSVTVYRSDKRADTYLYLASDRAFDSLPAALLQQFGEGQAFLDLELQASTKLAQAEAPAVLAAISDQGFYLQLPPNEQPKELIKDQPKGQPR